MVVALAVENAPADVVAAELGIDRAHLVGARGKAVGALALEYESVAFAGAVEEPNLGAAMRNERRQHRTAEGSGGTPRCGGH